MKIKDLNRMDESIRLKKKHFVKEEKELEEDSSISGMKKFDMQYTVDGVRSNQTVSAESPQKAEELIKKQYDGKTIVFTSKNEVHESLEENYDKKDVESFKSKVIRFKDAYQDFLNSLYEFDDEMVNDVIVDEYPFDLSFDEIPFSAWFESCVENCNKLMEKTESLTEDLDTPSTPESGEETGLSNMIITAINDEWKTIAYYNDLVEVLRKEGKDDMVNVIYDIANEENKHVGQLQEMLKQISPNTMSISDGETEGSEQMHAEDCCDSMFGDIEYDNCEIDYPVDDDFGTNSGFDIYLM